MAESKLGVAARIKGGQKERGQLLFALFKTHPDSRTKLFALLNTSFAFCVSAF
jgi:hypothetical protein